MIKAILFDLDGVIVDSSKTRLIYKKDIFEAAGYNDIPEEFILDKSKPIKQIVEEALAQRKITSRSEIERVFEFIEDDEIRSRLAEHYIFPNGIKSALKKLSEKYSMAIVTSRVRSGVEEIFGLINIREYFDFEVTFEDTTHHKPHPEPLNLALKKLGLRPEETIYVGDSDSDRMAAFTINMPFIHFSCEEHDPNIHAIEHFSDLPNAIQLIDNANNISS